MSESGSTAMSEQNSKAMSVQEQAMSETLLIELGTEELPPKALRTLSEAFTKELLAGLLEAQLIDSSTVDNAIPYATPRRLALQIPKVAKAQPNQTIERRGPAVQAAFDDNGEPKPAALGFAKSCGVEVADLQQLETDKGEWLSFSLEQTGKPVADLVPAIIDQAIKRLPIAKRMRWGSSDAEFVRPVQWLVVLHGNAIIPATVLEVNSSNTTRGHRFHSQGDLILNHANEYQEVLANAHVVASFGERQTMIVEQINTLANSINGQIEDDPALLDEVTGLVEHPTAVLGNFENDFLQVPQECLISSMRDHQKYFHILDTENKLVPNFITVSNIESKDPGRVIQGNERVLRARLSDARFFWETDQKVTLADRVEKLGSVLFHIKLGTVLDKAKRLEALAGSIAQQLGGDKTLAKRGGLLAKADLVSDMVGEFDELQGIMGHYYAQRDGEQSIVGESIEQHYWPKFAGDALPVSVEAQAVALADKLDSLVGIFGSGETPTGDKDPYALRRAALSILRILIENQHSLGLSQLVAKSAQIYSDHQGIEIETGAQQDIVAFIRGRLTAFYQNQDIATNTINAVMACEPDSPIDFERRVKAVHEFSGIAEASDLSAANKRISNILKKQAVQSSEVDPSLLTEAAEKALHQAIDSIAQSCNELFDAGNYSQGLQQLAALRSPVDDFFDQVMVMSDDARLQNNRLALLHSMQKLFLRVADISQLQN